MFKKEKI